MQQEPIMSQKLPEVKQVSKVMQLNQPYNLI